MKLLFLTLLVYSSTNIFASATSGKNNGDADGTFTTPKTQGTFFQAPVNKDSLLQNLIDKNDQARAVFDQCKSTLSGEEGEAEYEIAEIEKCVWEGIKGKKEGDPPIVTGVKDMPEVIAEMKKLLPKGATDENLDANPASQTQDEATQKLADYYKKNFEKEIFKMVVEDENGKNTLGAKTADHQVFFALYEAQVSRGILLAISEYCIDADPEKRYTIPRGGDKSIIEQRKKNMDQLGSSLENANANWGSCAVNIQNICHGVAFYDNAEPPVLAPVKEPISINRACMVTKFIKKSRQELMAKESIAKRLKELEKEQEKNGTIVASAKSANEQVFKASSENGEKSIDDMIIVSSEEAVTGSGFDKATEEQLEEFKKCSEQQDQKECEKYFSQDREEAEKMMVEYRLRAEVLAEDLNDIETDNEKLEKYLKSQGYSDEKIAELSSVDADGNGELDIVKEIKDNYEAERKAVIADLSDKIERRTAASSGGLDLSNEKNMQKIKELELELKDRPQRQKDLIRFTNFVSSLVSVEQSGSDDEGGQPKNLLNTRALEVELAGLRNIEADPDDPEEYAKLQGLIESSDLVLKENADKSSNGDAASFKIDTINQLLLKYGADQSAPAETK